MITFWATIVTIAGALLGRMFSALLVDLPIGLIFVSFDLPVAAAEWVGAFFSSLPVYYGARIGSRIFNRNGNFAGSRGVVAFFAAFVMAFFAAVFFVFQLSLMPETIKLNYAIASVILPTVAAYFGSLSGTRSKKIKEVLP